MADTERTKILICIKASDHIYRTLNPRAIFDFSLDAFPVSYSSVMADNSRESLSLQWFVLWKSENVSPGKMPREKREKEREWKKGWAIYFPFRVTFFGPELIQKEMSATKTDTDNFLCYSECLCVQMCRAWSLVDRAQEILHVFILSLVSFVLKLFPFPIAFGVHSPRWVTKHQRYTVAIKVSWHSGRRRV